METASITLLVTILVFLLIVFLGLQLQITTAGRDLAEIKEDIKRLADEVARLKYSGQ